MPTYDYRCRTCGVSFEIQQSFTEDSLTRCPAANSAQAPAACTTPGEGVVRKVFSAPSITFKGEGFYKTDSRSGATRSGNGAKEGAKENKEKEPAGGASKSDDSTKATPGGGESTGGAESKGDRAAAGATSS